MRDHIRERVLMLGNYIVESGATVRQTACRFGVSKSTVHTVVTEQNVGKRKKSASVPPAA